MSDSVQFSRRRILVQFAGAAGLCLGGAWAKGANAQCVDLTADNANPALRAALNFTEQSANPAETCKGCAFFVNDDPSGKCGSCKIFTGPTNPNGRCDSWAPPKK